MPEVPFYEFANSCNKLSIQNNFQRAYTFKREKRTKAALILKSTNTTVFTTKTNNDEEIMLLDHFENVLKE